MWMNEWGESRMPPCTKAIKVKTPSGAETQLVPKKVWLLQPKGGKGIKIGLFHDPSTGKYFRAKVPADYPECA
jgi:hypothetical protein